MDKVKIVNKFAQKDCLYDGEQASYTHKTLQNGGLFSSHGN